MEPSDRWSYVHDVTDVHCQNELITARAEIVVFCTVGDSVGLTQRDFRDHSLIPKNSW